MTATRNDIGIVGLGVMGRNLALNLADHGFRVAVYNRTGSVTRDFAVHLQPGQEIHPCYSPEELVAALPRPRKVMIMVNAGPPVDTVLATLRDLLEPGDVAIDGGNSHFRDTKRRAEYLAAKGIAFLGVGISGGEFGARTGPSIMPGGPREAYEAVRPFFEAIAARADGEPCVAYLGPDAAGHYVKMVHNGIEYGLMQLIADTYVLLKQVLALSNDELAGIYTAWDGAEPSSYLVEITAKIFTRRDEKTGAHLIDVIRGEAGQLGTGMWTSQSAMDLQVPSPSVDIAVAMRNLSALEEERRALTAALTAAGAPDDAAAAAGAAPAGPGDTRAPAPGAAARTQADDSDRATADNSARLTVADVRGALLAGMIVTYAQGFAHLRTASTAMGLELRLEDVASVWRGGCIIRSALLGDIRVAFRRNPVLANLLLDGDLSRMVATHRDSLVRAVAAAVRRGVPVPGLMTALAYLDTYRAEWLPFNLVQAQRDYFGAHTYERIDEDGVFHTDWLADGGGS